MTALISVDADGDILEQYRGTAVAELLRCTNLGATLDASAPRILVATCLDPAATLKLPAGFAVVLRTAGARLKRVPFKVSWAIAAAGVEAIALIAHGGCSFAGLRESRERFVARLEAAAGWERTAAEQHFDHWASLFEVEEPAQAVLAESRRLASRYPGIPVAPLWLDSTSGRLAQIVESDA